VGKRLNAQGAPGADLRDQHLRGGAADAGDRVQELDHLLLLIRLAPGHDLGVEAPDRLLDTFDLHQQFSEQEPVVRPHAPGERRRQLRPFRAQLAAGQVRQVLRVVLAGRDRRQHGAPG
jgi:hypothetical protein